MPSLLNVCKTLQNASIIEMIAMDIGIHNWYESVTVCKKGGIGALVASVGSLCHSFEH